MNEYDTRYTHVSYYGTVPGGTVLQSSVQASSSCKNQKAKGSQPGFLQGLYVQQLEFSLTYKFNGQITVGDECQASRMRSFLRTKGKKEEVYY